MLLGKHGQKSPLSQPRLRQVGLLRGLRRPRWGLSGGALRSGAAQGWEIPWHLVGIELTREGDFMGYE